MIAKKFMKFNLAKMLKRRWRLPQVEWRLENLQLAGFNPRRIIDVGAYRADWSRFCKNVFPTAPILLIEPMEHELAALKAFCTAHPDCQYIQALVGASQGELLFLEQDSNSRVISETDAAFFSNPIKKRTVDTLWGLVKDTDFANADLLKVDAQGHDLEILKGAGDLFGSVEVIILEISVLRIGPCPILAEVLQFMEQHGYRLYDLMDLNYRPLDNALWQLDGIFVKEDSSLIASQAWG